jgi:hypothetical protein
MQDRGFNWLQSTIYKTETAGRPVRVDEAVALADLLQVKLNDLVDPRGQPMVERVQELLNSLAAADRNVKEKEHELKGKQREYDEARELLEWVRKKVMSLEPLANYCDKGTPLDRESIKEVVHYFGAGDEWLTVLREFSVGDEELAIATELAAEAGHDG